MCDPSADELLTKLAFSLRQYERNIRNGESKLCLTGNSVVFLDKCFAQAAHVDLRKLGAERVYSKSSQSSVDFLCNLTKEASSLKIVPGPSPRLDILLSISHFKNLQFLEIKKIPLGYITGLQSLRQQLKGLTCSRSVFALSEVFICCGGDLSSTPFAWERLQEVNLSYNSINTFDDSLKVLPVLELLNLSHNNIISPDEDDDWQSLLELKHINLGYNQLDKVPCASTLKHSLKTLILRNNNIQHLKGIEHFKLLEILDVSNNCITSFQELFPLAHLERLLCLQLAGNPVCYCNGYRVRVVSYMSPFPRRGDVFLDNKKLSPFEKTFVGISVDPVSPLAYLSADVSNEVVVDSSQDMTDQNLPSRGAKKKKVKVKPRNVSIASDTENENAYSSSAVPSQEVSLDHSQDIERLEKARNLGGEHWLPAINQVLHGGEPSEQQPSKDEKLESISTSPYFVHHENVIVDVNPSPIERKTSIASLHSDDEQVVSGMIQPFIVTLKTMDPTSDSHEEEKEEHDLLVTVTDHYIRERDFKNGKVVCKLETGSLLSANIEESEDGEIFVHLRFDYMSRERKERVYVMDGRESCEQFIEALHPLMNSNDIAKKSIVTEHLQCLKCSAHFTENANKTSGHICPDCGSTQIIEILSPDEPINTRNVDRSTEVQTTLPDLISSVSPNRGIQMDHPDLYISRKGYDKHLPGNELEVLRVTEKSLDKSISSVSSTANTESPVINQEIIKNYNISQATGFVVSNAAGFPVNKQSVAKTSRSSVLSNSLMNLEVTKSDMALTKVNPNPKTITPQKRVIDSPISLKTSSQKASSDYSEASKATHQSGDDLDGTGVPSSVEKTFYQRKVSGHHTKVSSSPSSTPRVFRNLFNKLGNKMSGSGTSGSSDEQESVNSKTPEIGGNLIYDISPDEFRECDHRLKLYFEVSLFTGRDKEFLNCLIKAPVVVYGDIKESSSLLVVSNIAIYILKLEETAGLSASECLSFLGSYSLKDIQFVDFGLGFQSFRVELSGESPGSFTFLVRDTERCKIFTDLLLKCVNHYKDENGLAQVVTTTRNLQTLAHIRAHIFGLQQENVHTMGERYLQQVTLFADPPLVKDRKSLLRHYSGCFIGKDFVDWMIHNGEARTRTKAVETVQRLVNAGLIEHVSKECKFEDKEQFYRFCFDQNEEGKENGKDGQDNQDELYDIDLNISSAVMAFKLVEPTREGMDVKPVTIIITSTHVCVGEENYKWPLPRYLDVPTPNDPQFHCVEKHKMTDVTGLELFEDKPCHVGILISEEDAPLECADSYLLIKTETKSSIESLINAIKIPWEEQFGVELQISTFPYLKK